MWLLLEPDRRATSSENGLRIGSLEAATRRRAESEGFEPAVQG